MKRNHYFSITMDPVHDGVEEKVKYEGIMTDGEAIELEKAKKDVLKNRGLFKKGECDVRILSTEDLKKKYGKELDDSLLEELDEYIC